MKISENVSYKGGDSDRECAWWGAAGRKDD